MYAVAVAGPLVSPAELLLSFEFVRERVSFPERVLTGEGVEVEPRLTEDFFTVFVRLAAMICPVEVVELLGSSAGGAATATLTNASKAAVPPPLCCVVGWVGEGKKVKE